MSEEKQGLTCQRCGYLRLVLHSMADDREVDPSELRKAHTVERLRTLVNEAKIAGKKRFDGLQEYSGRVDEVVAGVKSYSQIKWQHTRSLSCARGMFGLVQTHVPSLIMWAEDDEGYRRDDRDRDEQNISNVEAVLDTISEDRSLCPNFFRYTDGLSTSEHRQMQIEADKREREREWEEAMEKGRRGWEMRWWVVTAAISAMVSLAVSVVAPIVKSFFVGR